VKTNSPTPPWRGVGRTKKEEETKRGMRIAHAGHDRYGISFRLALFSLCALDPVLSVPCAW
jgi:hypothetical protein